MSNLFERRKPGHSQPNVGQIIGAGTAAAVERQKSKQVATERWKERVTGEKLLPFVRGTGEFDKKGLRQRVVKALTPIINAPTEHHPAEPPTHEGGKKVKGAYVPQEVKLPAVFRVKAKSWGDLGIKPVSNVGVRKRYAGKEALKHPGGVPIHAGSSTETAPEKGTEITSKNLPMARSSYRADWQNPEAPAVETSGEESCPECTGVLGTHGFAFVEHPSGDVPHPQTGGPSFRFVTHGQKGILPAKDKPRHGPISRPIGIRKQSSEAGWDKVVRGGSGRTSLAALKGANILTPPEDKPKVKDSINSFPSNLLLIEYIIKAHLEKSGWIPWRDRKAKEEAPGPEPHGPPGTARPVIDPARPVMGFKKGPHYLNNPRNRQSSPSERAKAELELNKLFAARG
jgi:hypothetical protein